MSLPHALLAMLATRPSSGSELMRRFDRSIGFYWSATHQQVYRELGRMTADAWIEPAEAPGADGRLRVYRVTDAGRDELVQWVATPGRAPSFRDALSIRVRAAAGSPEADAGAAVREHLAEHRRRLARFAAFVARDTDRADGDDRQRRLERLILERGIAYERWEVEWTERALAALAEP